MKPSVVQLAPDFDVPAEILTSAIGVLGIRGSGKTTTAGVIVEEAICLGVPAVTVDPTGAWYGLKSSADGKSPGLPVFVFGGEHGDVPLEPESGAIVGRFIVEKRVSCVLDLSLMTKGKQVHFVADLLETIYHLNRDPLLVVIDETARFCPQSARGIMTPDIGRCIGAVDDIGALGRRRGLGIVVIGQRASRINKDVLSQCTTVIAMQTSGPHDRKALAEWVHEQHGDGPTAAEFLKSLTTLKVGEGFVWSPAFLGVFRKVQIRNRRTFDSSATPKIGQKAITPKAFAEVDLGALTAELRSVRDRAQADDPKILRKQIAELEAQLRTRPAATAASATVEKIVEVSVLTEQDRNFMHNQIMGAGGLWERMVELSKETQAALVELAERFDAKFERRLPPVISLAHGDIKRGAPPQAAPKAEPARRGEGSAFLSKAERAILTVLAQYPDGRTKTQIAILTGYAVNGGGFNNAISSLRTKGFAERGEPVRATANGVDALGSWEPLPTGDALLQYWYGQLSRAEAAVLRALAGAYPHALPKAEVAFQTGYEANGGGFNNACSRLRTLQLIEGRGEMVASGALFG